MVVIEDASSRMDTVCAPLKVRRLNFPCRAFQWGNADLRWPAFPEDNRSSPIVVVDEVEGTDSQYHFHHPSDTQTDPPTPLRPSGFPVPSTPARPFLTTVPPRSVRDAGGVHRDVSPDARRVWVGTLFRWVRPGCRHG